MPPGHDTQLANLQDEPRWHQADSDKYESEGEGERYEFGQECLDRVSLALGGNTIVPLASTLLPALTQDAGDWRKRHAALICLSQIAEGCVKVLSKNIPGLADLCLAVRTQPLTSIFLNGTPCAACRCLHGVPLNTHSMGIMYLTEIIPRHHAVGEFFAEVCYAYLAACKIGTFLICSILASARWCCDSRVSKSALTRRVQH